MTLSRNLLAEPIFPTNDIQGDILVGLPKNKEHLIFFEITAAPKFKAFLRTLEITSMQECLNKRAAIAANKANGIDTLIPTPGLNIAFTYKGLEELNAPNLPAPTAASVKTFHDGLAASGATLNDPPSANWKILKPSDKLHGVFIVTGASQAEVVDVIDLRLVPSVSNGWKQVHEEIGQVRPDPVRGHEHFGFADGVSQPGIRGLIAANIPFIPRLGPNEDQGQRGQDLLWPGEFLFGYKGQNPNPGPGKDFSEPGQVKTPPAPFMENGAFMVFRRLAQKVPEFNASVKHAAAAVAAGPEKPTATMLGAQLVGRWKSGAPLELTPTKDDPMFADGTIDVNNFEFGDDREGVRCPWAAHIRKAYPRNDVRGNTNPQSQDIVNAEAFTQTHRMLRRGIAFGPEVTEQEVVNGQSREGDHTRGLLFKCYITSIENQFEFVQQSWCNNVNFSQPNSGIDAIIGQGPAGSARPFLGAAPNTENPVNKPLIPSLGLFVELEGGAYFFAPSIPAIKSF
jgi:Dyp-type peroxidase family